MQVVTLILVIFQFFVASGDDTIPSTRVPRVDVAYFGDSQLWYTFRGIEDFHQNIADRCPVNKDFPFSSSPISYAGVGVSHSGFDDWSEKYKVQATKAPLFCRQKDGRAFGQLYPKVDSSRYQYWQRLCQPGKSGLDAIIDMKPKVVIGMILGRHTGSNFEEQTTKAFNQFLENLPTGIACVIITSPPLLDVEKLPEDIQKKDRANIEKDGTTYESRIKNNRNWSAHRTKVAKFIHNLVNKSNRCKLIPGHDQEILRDDYKNYRHLTSYSDPESLILDTHHLNEAGGKKFINLISEELCSALSKSLAGGVQSEIKDDVPRKIVPAAN